MAVPNTNTFSLSDVITEVGAATPDLAACFAAAMPGRFDTDYANDKNDLLEFRNYGHSQPFIISMRTTSNNEIITIPTSGGGYNYNVDWGDGLASTGRTGDASHTYSTAGTYNVQISGVFPRIYFNSAESRTNLVDIKQWGSNPWDTFYNAFAFCSNLAQISATDTPNLSNVTNMEYMFRMATSFNGDISDWDVSNVTDMYGMFGQATSFNGDLSTWDVSSVTNMNSMFYEATSFNRDISNWNVSNVTNMAYMFYYATSFNADLRNWNVSNVSYMNYMFGGVNMTTTNYSNTLINWSALSLKSNVSAHFNTSKYNSSAVAARAILTNTYGWTITDGGLQ